MGALYFGRAVFEPLAFALFIIALSAPMLQWLQPKVGKMLVLMLTVCTVISVVLIFFTMVFWGVGQVAAWVIANIGLLETVYRTFMADIEDLGFPLDILLPSNLEPRW